MQRRKIWYLVIRGERDSKKKLHEVRPYVGNCPKFAWRKLSCKNIDVPIKGFVLNSFIFLLFRINIKPALEKKIMLFRKGDAFFLIKSVQTLSWIT